MNTYHIIGSLNMDLTSYITRFHEPGETILGQNFSTKPGGKGANQAVALARLNINCLMYGKLGKDQYGSSYLNTLQHEGVDSRHIEVLDSTHTGLAIIEVEQKTAQNRIIVIPGANTLVDKEYIHNSINTIIQLAEQYPHDTHYVLLQLEVPLDSVCLALELVATKPNIISILDPAPVPQNGLPDSMYRYIDYITPNETETQYLTGINLSQYLDSKNDADIQNDPSYIKDAAQTLLDKGCRHVIIKAGKRGAFLISQKEYLFAAQEKHIKAVDTTAAGDSFNAGFVYALGNNFPHEMALKIANKVAGISTTKAGAQSAMPRLEQIMQDNYLL